MTNAILRGKPDAGNPHVRFDEGEVASAKPRRGSLLYKQTVVAALAAVTLATAGRAADDLATTFAAPPKTARPETWFHLINGNVSKEGITADLEAISAAGISGIQLFHGNIGGRGLWPGVTNPVYCLSAKWEDNILHAATECRRLGLTFRMQNCPGWSMSGGPWIRDDQAMRRLVWGRAFAQGGKPVKTRIRLKGPDLKNVATLAFRCPAGDVNPFTKEPGFLKPVAVTGGGKLASAWRDLFLKGEAISVPAGTWTVELDFGKPVTLRTMEPPGVKSWCSELCYADGATLAAVRVEPDGKETALGRWSKPRANWQDNGNWSIALADDKPTRKLRLTIENGYGIRLGRFTFISQAHPDNYEGESYRTLRSLVRREHAALDPAACVNPAEVVDLTAMTDAKGNVTWNDVPVGDWEIFRLGHVRENKRNGPAPVEATGWECDKLSPHGVEASFAGYIGRLTDPKTGVLRGGLLKGALFDSWECETQNWTPGLDAAFEKRYGYRLLPWMPAVIGYVVRDRESTARFLRDWRTFLGDCIEMNFFGHVAKLCHERGLDMSFETAFGDVLPGDILGYYRYCDVPMCEYWQPKSANGWVGDSDFKDVRPTVSAAKMYGKRRVAAEALTSFRLTWNEHPRFFKSYHDEHYALGVTHPVFHTYTHHPQTDGFKRPGTSFGGDIGSPFLRGQTWWRHMAAFTEYIARCTALAEAGDTVADVLYYLGDEANAKPPFTLADLPPTYHCDYCNQDALLNRIVVKDGKWALPEGGAYAVLWLPDCKRLMPETLEKVLAGVKQGARVCGRRPDAPATLAGGAATEAKFATLREAIWGGAFADRVSEGAITAALTAAGCAPDVTVTTADGRDWSQRTRDGKEGLAWSHRTAKGRHWYFFAAPAERPFAGTVKLRGGAKRRFEFWDATNGRRTAATAKMLADGSAEIALDLAASESVFVVEAAQGAAALAPAAGAQTETALVAPWRVTFEKGWGCDEPVELAKLVPWCDLPGGDEAKAYSGTATYATTFKVERASGRLTLDLGRVEMVAAVRVNGKAAGTLWTWPYRVDVTDLVKNGENTLEIDVTGTWYNRLAYDESLPVAQRKTWSRHVPKAGAARVPYGLLGPVKICGWIFSHEKNG